MANYSKPLPQRAPLGPNVIADQGCWYPWIPPWPYWPQLTPHWTPGPQITPGETPGPSITPGETPIPQATPHDQPPDSSTPQDAPSTSTQPLPEGNPGYAAHAMGVKDGRKDVWRPRRFASAQDRALYRMGWKEGQQQRRFTNPEKSKPIVFTQPTKGAAVPHSTLLKPRY